MVDENGRKHAPKGSREGGRFVSDNGGADGDNANKMQAAIRKYSDDPSKDLAENGIQTNSLSDFISRVKRGEAKASETFELGEITDRARADIERLTGQKLNATKHVIDEDTIRHIEKRHGKNGLADSSMASVSDYEDIITVLRDYQSVDFARNQNGQIEYSHKYKDSNNRPVPHIMYTMKNGKTMYLIEAVSDSKKGVLHIVSAYKN